MNAVEIQDLAISYEGTPAVRGVSLVMPAGRQFTLLGASGCGKTTTLRAIAGLERPSAGRILLFGEPVFDAARGIDVPAEQRGVSMVFQSYAIWPHMTVLENVSYGLRVRKLPAAEVRRRSLEALELVGLSDFADRPSVKLSGGQQQRVALARSFVFEPKVLLFDEPLSNLDAKLRAHMRVELKELARRLSLTSVYVTHDQEEALAMSDTIAVMDKGVVRQVADPLTLYHRPADSFVADFIGDSNLLKGVVEGPLDDPQALRVRLENGVTVTGTAVAPPPAREVVVGFKSVHVKLGAGETTATVRRRVFLGDAIEYFLDWNGSSIRVRQSSSEMIDEGRQVSITIDPGHAVVLAR